MLGRGGWGFLAGLAASALLVAGCSSSSDVNAVGTTATVGASAGTAPDGDGPTTTRPRPTTTERSGPTTTRARPTTTRGASSVTIPDGDICDVLEWLDTSSELDAMSDEDALELLLQLAAYAPPEISGSFAFFAELVESVILYGDEAYEMIDEDLFIEAAFDLESYASAECGLTIDVLGGGEDGRGDIIIDEP